MEKKKTQLWETSNLKEKKENEDNVKKKSRKRSWDVPETG